jgi:hypothetical protein
MKNTGPITQEFFLKRLADLCLKSGLAGFPKDETDQHILLKSAVLVLGKPGPFTEKEVDEKLKYWIKEISRIQKMDHVTVRRFLIDTGYLTRSADGSSYQIQGPRSQPPQFEAAVDEVDVAGALKAAREEIEQRKRAYLEKAKMQGKG